MDIKRPVTAHDRNKEKFKPPIHGYSTYNREVGFQKRELQQTAAKSKAELTKDTRDTSHIKHLYDHRRRANEEL